MKKETKEQCDRRLAEFGYSPLPLSQWAKVEAFMARVQALARLGPAADSNAIGACTRRIEQIFVEHCNTCERISPVLRAATDPQLPTAELDVSDWEAKMRAAKTPRDRRRVAIAFENAVRARLPEMRRRAASFSLYL